MYSCEKSLTFIIVPFRKKQGAGSESRVCYIMHVYIYSILFYCSVRDPGHLEADFNIEDVF